MTRVKRTLGVVAIAGLVFALPARAETIQITSGALDWNITAPNTVTLNGQGFTFEGFAASPAGGIFQPWSLCNQSHSCVAGASVDLMARFQGNDLPGTATLNGVTYTNVGSLDGDSRLDTIWTGTLVIPSGFTGGTVTAPFGFTGAFSVDQTSGAITVTNLVGGGTATLTFAPFADGSSSFLVTDATYEFEAAAAPVPEPMSMLLVGTGLAGLAASRRRRRSKETEDPA